MTDIIPFPDPHKPLKIQKKKRDYSSIGFVLLGVGLGVMIGVAIMFYTMDMPSYNYDCVDYCNNWCAMCVPSEIPNNPMAEDIPNIDWSEQDLDTLSTGDLDNLAKGQEVEIIE